MYVEYAVVGRADGKTMKKVWIDFFIFFSLDLRTPSPARIGSVVGVRLRVTVLVFRYFG